MTVNYEGVLCHSVGSPPSLPRPSHPPQWASDGEEPSPHFSMRSDVSLITEKEMLNRVNRNLSGTGERGRIGSGL